MQVENGISETGFVIKICAHKNKLRTLTDRTKSILTVCIHNQLNFSPLIFPFIMLSALDLITFVLRPSNLLNVLSVYALVGLPPRGVQWLLNTSFSVEDHRVLFIAVYFVLDIINGTQPNFYRNQLNNK